LALFAAMVSGVLFDSSMRTMTPRAAVHGGVAVRKEPTAVGCMVSARAPQARANSISDDDLGVDLTSASLMPARRGGATPAQVCCYLMI
tara:strand:- start:31 stop:297 length:267 start_codon:yes stop_codon:yes gene_type:complete